MPCLVAHQIVFMAFRLFIFVVSTVTCVLFRVSDERYSHKPIRPIPRISPRPLEEAISRPQLKAVSLDVLWRL